MSAPTRVPVVLGILLGLVLTGTSALANTTNDPPPDYDGNTDGGTANVGVTDPGSTDDGGGSGSGSPGVVTVPQPYLEYRYVPFCLNSGVPDKNAEGGQTGLDNLCTGATAGCDDPRDTRYRVYTLRHGADGSVRAEDNFEFAGVQCRGPDDPPEGGPVQITVADIRDEAQKAAPVPVVNVEPENRSYVNLPTNVFADDEGAVEVTVQLLGQPIALSFEPTAWVWDFGDGGSGSGQGIEGARVGQAGAVEHEYRRSGDASITLTRTYAVTFTVPGGQPTPLPGTINAASEPYPLEIREIQATVTELG